LFAAQLADDRLHAHALHPDTGADAVYVAVAALHRDFRALARLTRAAANRHRSIVDFRYLLLEQPHHQFGRCARHQNARSLTRLIHELDHAAHAIARAVTFEPRLFLLRQPGFGLPEIEYVVRPFHALDGAIHQLAGASRVLVKNRLALRFANLLKYHLLGGL